MGRKCRAHARVIESVLAAILTALGSLPACAIEEHHFNIPEEGAASAIRDFGAQAHLQILVAGENVKGKKLHAVSGKLTTEQALNVLLDGSGLTHQYVSDHSVALMPIAQVTTDTSTPTTPREREKEGQGSPGSFRVAQAAATQAGGAAAVSAAATGGASNESSESAKTSGQLEEVIVTAQKRAENLLEVPVPVTALSADVLTENNMLRLQDYYTQVPGLTVTPGDYTGGASSVSIRGITTGSTGYGTNPTVAIVIDDVPYGGTTALGGGGVPPDIDPSELSRIEVLRGPQGTLYGASSIGGLIKFVTVDPAPRAFNGHVEADTDTIYNGVGLGYGVRGSVNVPVSDTFAFRVGGFARQDPGYEDNVQTRQNGVNRREVDGGRISALWRPSDDLSVKASALYQDSRRSGGDVVNIEPGLGDLQQSAIINSGVYDARNQAYSLNLTAKLGAATLTALSGYGVDTMYTNWDYTPLFGTITQGAYGVSGTPWEANNKLEKFSQELRLSVPFGQHIDWLLGAFYTNEEVTHDEQFHAVTSSGEDVALLEDTIFATTYKEYAAFTDLTVNFTDRFDVQIGGRISHNRQSYWELDTGPYTPLFFLGKPSPVFFPTVNTSENPFTYLLTPEFKITPDVMVYARLASGYRPGGPNFEATTLGLPATFSSDTTKNYEIGTKGTLLDHIVSFDVSLYYIDWKDIQIYLTNPLTGNGYYANGSAAKSEGAEISVEARPGRGLKVAAWVAVDDAVLTRSFPATAIAYGVSGNRLPYSPKFSSNVSLDEEFALGSGLKGFVGGMMSYIGDRQDLFTYTAQRQSLPGFAQTDLHAGVKARSWTVNLFANNVADKRGLLAGGIGNVFPSAFHIVQPRTIGVTAIKTF